MPIETGLKRDMNLMIMMAKPMVLEEQPSTGPRQSLAPEERVFKGVEKPLHSSFIRVTDSPLEPTKCLTP